MATRNSRNNASVVDRTLRFISMPSAECYLCGRRLAHNNITSDHVLPRSRGGADGSYNRRPACLSCNAAKGSMTLREYFASVLVQDRNAAVAMGQRLITQRLAVIKGDRMYFKQSGAV